MNRPLLTIGIPTYNRLRFLKRNLNALLPQLTDDVGVLISDNASTDGTSEYLQSLPVRIQVRRNAMNLGAMENVRRCLYGTTGEYVWLLCDDDFPPAGVVNNILHAIRLHAETPLLFLRSRWLNLDAFDTTGLSVHGQQDNWVWHDKNTFLGTVGQFVSVGSSIVIRKGILEKLDLGRWGSSFLMPMAITLFTVGAAGGIFVSAEPFVYCQGGNSGGYNGLAVFAGEQAQLLDEACRRFGYERSATNLLYNIALAGVISSMLRSWPLTTKGLVLLVRYGWRHPNFYRVVLPVLYQRMAKGIRWRLEEWRTQRA